MLKIMVIAGSVTEQLTQFLGSKGQFEIVAKYDNIHENIDELSNSVFSVDKFLYLANDTSAGTSDMKALRKILTNNPLLIINEFIFLGRDDEDGENVFTFFERVMQLISKTEFTYKLSSTDINYSEVSNILLGITKMNNSRNKFNVVKRLDHSDNSTVAYPKTNNKNTVIENYNYNIINNHKATVEVIQKIDGTMGMSDNTSNVIKKHNNLVLPKLVLPKDNIGANVFISTGYNKTGKSVFTCGCAYSSLMCEKTVCIIDYSNNGDIGGTLIEDGIKYNNLSMRSIITGEKLTKDLINVISPKNDLEMSTRIDFLQMLFSSQYNLVADVIFIHCDRELLADIVFLLSNKIASIWMFSSRNKFDITAINTELLSLVKSFDVCLVLSDIVKYRANKWILEYDAIKTIVAKDVRIVKPVIIKDIKIVGKSLHEDLVLPRLER